MDRDPKVKLTLELSPEAAELLQGLADMMHTTKSEVLRKGLALMKVAADAKKDGRKLGVAAGDQPLATEIVGIF
jgi:predicted transcriptional regulator